MKLYRIIDADSNDVLEEGLRLSDAHEIAMMYSDPSSPRYKPRLEIKEYDLVSVEGKRLGRDPDLH